MKHPTKYEKTSPGRATKEFINEGKQITATLMKNHDLIAKRIELLIKQANSNALTKISLLQGDINLKLQGFKNKFFL
ncbi:MAG: hypothetical protein HC831_22560 [Chloroflexia bacterium]|nr:hypothetical protein [Chloroflexia bacterium]